MSDKINLNELRAAAEEANHPGSEYADVLAMFDLLGPPTVLALIDAVEAAWVLLEDERSDDKFINFMATLTRFNFGDAE